MKKLLRSAVFVFAFALALPTVTLAAGYYSLNSASPTTGTYITPVSPTASPFAGGPSSRVTTTTTTTTTTPTTPTSSCYTFTLNLVVGSTGADVSALQTYLIAKGYLTLNVATGYYGAQTGAAVARYQQANGIAPVNGYFGPITRAYLNAHEDCTTTTTGTSTAPVITSVTLSTTASTTPLMQITGSGFDSNNYVLFDGNVAARSVYGSNGTLTFAPPTYLSPACGLFSSVQVACPAFAMIVDPSHIYKVTVQNAQGTSNALTYPSATTSTSSTSNLSISQTGTPLHSQNYVVNTTDTTIAPAVIFNLKSETGDSKISSVSASSVLTGVDPSMLTYYLYDGTTLLSSQNGTTNGVVFGNLAYIVPKDYIKTFTVKIGFPAYGYGISGFYVATTSITQVNYQKPNGSQAIAIGPITGVAQYVFPAAPQIAIASAPTTASTVNTSGQTIGINATFTFNVAAVGGNMTQPLNSDFVIAYGTSTANPLYIVPSISVVTIPNNAISNGSVANVTITASVPASVIPGSAPYYFTLKSFKWKVGNVTATQTWGLDDFKAGPVNVVKGTTPASTTPIVVATPKAGDAWLESPVVTSTLSGNEAYTQDITWTVSPDYPATDTYSTNPSVKAYLEQLINGQYVTIGRIPPFAYGSIRWVVGLVSNTGCDMVYPSNLSNSCFNMSNMKVVPAGQYYVHLYDIKTNTDNRSGAFNIVASSTVASVTLNSQHSYSADAGATNVYLAWNAPGATRASYSIVTIPNTSACTLQNTPNMTSTSGGTYLVTPSGASGCSYTFTYQGTWPNGTTKSDTATLTVNTTTTTSPVTVAPQFVLASTPSIVVGTNGAVTGTFSFNVTNPNTSSGVAMTKPVSSDFSVLLGKVGNAGGITPSSQNVIIIPNYDIYSGSTGSVTVTAQVPASAITAGGQYQFYINAIKYTLGGIAYVKTDGLDNFRTSAVTVGTAPTPVQPINVIIPVDGFTVQPGNLVNIHWGSSGATSYNISYTNIDTGATGQIASGVTGNGYGGWTLPLNFPLGHYRVTLTDANQPASKGSSGVFTVTATGPAPVLNVAPVLSASATTITSGDTVTFGWTPITGFGSASGSIIFNCPTVISARITSLNSAPDACLSGSSATGISSPSSFKFTNKSSTAYPVQVYEQYFLQNAISMASNMVTITVNPAPAPVPPTPVVPAVTSVSPTAGLIGTTVTVIGTGFDTQNYVMLDDRKATDIISSSDGKTLTFSVPSTTNPPCYFFNRTTRACNISYIPAVAPGDHTISVMTPNGTSNSVKFTVVQAALTTSPAPTNASPTAAIIKANVGFTASVISAFQTFSKAFGF